MRRSLALALLLLGACARERQAAPASSPGGATAAEAPSRTAPSRTRTATEAGTASGTKAGMFRDVTKAAGIDFVHDAGRSEDRFLPEAMGSGVAVLDFDGDGRQDLYFVGSGPVPADGAPPAAGRNKLYRNLGDWRFEDVTQRAGVPGRGCGMGAAAGDADRDGDMDLLVTGYGATIFYLNRGDGTFVDATTRSGLEDSAWTTGAAFLDFDADGALDVALQRYVKFSRALHRPCLKAGAEVYCTPQLLDPEPNRLFRGRGDGTFQDVSATSGVGEHAGKGLGVVASDLDLDGDTDLYFANDTFRNFLFENRGGGRFEEVGLVSGSAYGADGREEAGMGADAGDLDGDGLPDLAVGNFENEPSDLYRNEGGLAFTEISGLSGLAAATRPRLKFGTRIADLDLDGFADLAFANGHVYDNASAVSPGSAHAQPGTLLLNLGDGRFEDVSASRGGDFARPHVGRGLATADLDDDGDLDLVLTANGGPPAVLENVAPARSWISVRCLGTKRDATAIGARVAVTAGGRTQEQEVRSGGSYLSQSDLRLSFGLGDAQQADSVVVTWPGGAREEALGVASGRRITFVEGSGIR